MLNLKLILILIFILCCTINLTAKDILPYATIGVRLGWDLRCGLTLSPRASFGLADLDRVAFISINTETRKFRNPIIALKEFSYFDIQAGASVKELSDILVGCGIGLFIGSTQESFKIIPRSTVFSGCFLFSTIDMTYWNRSKISFDTGVEAVLPIPMGGIDLGLIGGS